MDIQLDLQTKVAFDDYGANIRAGVRGLWSGAFGYLQFIDHMMIALDRGYMRAWTEGAGQFGIRPDEFTAEETRARLAQINNDIPYVYRFADAITAGSKANGGKLTPLLQRAAMWQSRYIAVREQAKSFAARDRKLQWRRGNTKQPCNDCKRYHGRIYRASVWREHGIYPRMWELECHGVHCQCIFVETTEAATPGFPPMPMG